jgi:hypothetical protein
MRSRLDSGAQSGEFDETAGLKAEIAGGAVQAKVGDQKPMKSNV